MPLPRATTPSLEALHAYALAIDAGSNASIDVSVIPHLLRAIELDPDFALALAALSGVYANTTQTALAPVYSKRAFDLRDRVSERERYLISWRYYRDALQDWAQALDLARAWTEAYPRDAFAFNALGLAAELHGLRTEAEAALRKAIELDPTFVPPKTNLADNLLRQNKLDEAMTHVTASRWPPASTIRPSIGSGYLAALLQDDAAGMATYLAGGAQDARRARHRQLGRARGGVPRAARRRARRRQRRAATGPSTQLQGVGGALLLRGRRDSRHRRPLRRGSAPGARWRSSGAATPPRSTSVPAPSAGAATRRRSSSRVSWRSASPTPACASTSRCRSTPPPTWCAPATWQARSLSSIA